VAAFADVPADWLSDAVKAFLSPRGEFDRYLELSHLQVFVAQPNYMLALKCMAMRSGEEFQDVDDARYLLRHLGSTGRDRDRDAVRRRVTDSRQDTSGVGEDAGIVTRKTVTLQSIAPPRD
jgi:hypothetical protein